MKKKLLLNLGFTHMTPFGLVGLPGMFDGSLLGLSGRDNAALKIALNFDPDIARAHGITVRGGDTEKARMARVMLNHKELPARYAGVVLKTMEDLKTVIDSASNYSYIMPGLYDAGTAIFILSKASATRLGLLQNGVAFDNDAVFIAAHGTSAEVFADMFDNDDVAPLHPSIIAAFFASDVFNQPLPTMNKITASHVGNGHDAKPMAFAETGVQA